MARLREGLRIGSLVGDDHAAKAPLAAHHVGDKAPVVAGPDQAHAIHAEHDAQGALVATRDAGLEGGQVHLADCLLVGERGHGGAHGLLVVEGKVLHEGYDALGARAVDRGCAEAAAQEAVLGVVLKVAARKGRAVNIHRGGVGLGRRARHSQSDAS